MFLILLATLLASAACDPLLFSAPILAGPTFSSALVAPAVSPPAAALVPTTYTSGLSPAVIPAGATPVSSVSSYMYGSGYSSQDYLVAPNAALTYAPYSLPYAYAADWYFRR